MAGYRFVIGDYLIIIFFLVLGGTGVFLNVSGATAIHGQKYLQIYVDNELVKEVSLNENDEGLVSFLFGSENEHEAIVEYSGGMARMVPLDISLCPRGICSHTGWISQRGETIVCLPNRIMIIFARYGDGGDDDIVDGITK